MLTYPTTIRSWGEVWGIECRAEKKKKAKTEKIKGIMQCVPFLLKRFMDSPLSLLQVTELLARIPGFLFADLRTLR